MWQISTLGRQINEFSLTRKGRERLTSQLDFARKTTNPKTIIIMKEKELYFSPETVEIKLRTEGVMCASEPIDNALGVGTDMFNYGEGTEQNW
jgi:hypothetical protein